MPSTPTAATASMSVHCRMVVTSSTTRAPASTAAPWILPACSQSADRWSPASTCGCRPVARSAMACAWSPVRSWPPVAPSPSPPATNASSCALSATAAPPSSASRPSSVRSVLASRFHSVPVCHTTPTLSVGPGRPVSWQNTAQAILARVPLGGMTAHNSMSCWTLTATARCVT